jgi:phage repressor protein C with HTH and peptisase S24 domain
MLSIPYFLTLGRQTAMAPGFSHRQIWAALDALAERHGLSASGLARKAGLDPTTFNPSKRESPGGRQRWPSTESIAKALVATGEGPGVFLALAGDCDGATPRRRVPAIGLADAKKDGSFDAAGRPTGPAWAGIGHPAELDDACYALKISGGSLAPLFRDGELLIVSPHAPARPGDRVAAKTFEGELLIAELRDQNARTLELRPLDGGASDRVLAREEIAWMSRIIWVSQ